MAGIFTGAGLGKDLGDDARGVTVLTCHGFAMRLVAGRTEPLDDDAFQDLMKQAVALLRGRGLPPEGRRREPRTAVERIPLGARRRVPGRRSGAYELVAAIAGRSLEDGDERLGLFAVADDDQNVYASSGASVRFIRRFEQDYGARIAFLTDNYRCTAYIVVASNTVIEPAAERATDAAAGKFCEW